MNAVPHHHPAEDTVLRHAAGTLSFGRSLVVATHLPFCPECQDAVRLEEAIGGALLDDLPPMDLVPDALARTLARLELPATPVEPAREPVVLADGVVLPPALTGLVRPRWRWFAPGISRIVVDVPAPGRDGQPVAAREHVCLLRIAPGQSLIDHGHGGWETCCVLAGSFSDATGRYGPGDVAETDEDVVHRPVAGPGEPCVCLVAWEGGLRMRGLLARLMQPLLGV
jgi:putative transcriptional regulator